MKTTALKVIAITMITAAVACIGSGCTGTVNVTDNETSSSVTINFDVDTESKTEQSKSTGSETASKEVTSKKDTESESSGSKAESKQEKKSESKAESKTESKTEQKVSIDANEIVGEWVYNVGDEYMAMTFAADGTVQAVAAEINNTMHGTWKIDGSQVKVTIYGGDSCYNYIDNTLVNADAPTQVFLKTTIDYSPKNNGDETYFDELVGSWEYNVGSKYIGMKLLDNGTAQIESTDFEGTEYGTWSVDGTTVTVVMVTGTTIYNYEDGRLVETDDQGHVVFKG